MDYLHWDYSRLSRGATVTVAMTGVESDVMLLSTTNYARFQRGDRYEYYGGHYKRSPVQLTVPSTGAWHVVVVPIGGRVEASVAIS
jgi:hypothetical protein